MKRGILCASVVLMAIFVVSNTITAAEEKKAEKITKDQLVGQWKHTPGLRKAFLLREDGSGTLWSHLNGVACNWDFNEHYQALVVATRQLKRQYKAKMEDGKILLYDGRDVFYRGANLNTLQASPLDKAVKVVEEGAAEKAEGKAEEKAEEKPEEKKTE